MEISRGVRGGVEREGGGMEREREREREVGLERQKKKARFEHASYKEPHWIERVGRGVGYAPKGAALGPWS